MAACPDCGGVNPDGFGFCGFCGARLVADKPASEVRKVVSVLFCDVVGFTSASEQADPEDVRARMERYYAALRPPIERFGGTIEKFIGDAVMAVFGVPVAHEDDAERAVRAGLAVLDAVRELNDRDSGPPLSVRVGINTGEVVARETVVATGALVLGDAVNTAARIQSSAAVDTVAVGERTFRETERVFVYEPLEPVAVKGKSEPVTIYRAVEPRGRFGIDLIRTHTAPFVGRTVELTLLQGLFERAARDRALQLVTLIGEPGVGKSRLVSELGDWVDDRPELVTWRQGRCLPYGDGITFWALSEIVKAQAGILESDAPEVAAGKLDAVLPEHEATPWLRARLLPLLGVDSGEVAARDEAFTAWRRFVEQLATDGPAVVVVEDLHWADDALLDFLAYLAEWSEDAGLLLICTARPELFDRHPTWAGGLRNAQTITLAPLSQAEMTELVEALASRVVSEQALQLILERSGGNPFYAEEFVRLTADRGAFAPETDEFPESVQALIAARIDTLSPERRVLLQDAAVVGKVFWAGAVAEIGGRSVDETERALHELSRRELVRPSRSSSMENEAEYAFWHTLVREVAYNQIPRADRIRRHEATAAWIERKAAERIEDHAEVLAHHYGEALELARAGGDEEAAQRLVGPAARHLALAGERALGLDAGRATVFLSRALALTDVDAPDRSQLLARYATALLEAGEASAAAAALDEALAFHPNPTAERAQLLVLRSDVALNTGEGAYGDLAREAVEILRTEAAGPPLVDALAHLAFAEWVGGFAADAAAAAEEALALSRRGELPEPGMALAVRAMAVKQASGRDPLADLERAIDRAVKEGAGRAAARLMNAVAITLWRADRLAASVDACRRGIAFSRERGLAGVASLMEGNLIEALGAGGEVDEALALAPAVAREAEERGDANAVGQARGVEVWLRAARGDPETALAVGAGLVDEADASGRADAIGTHAAVLSALVAAGRTDEARTLLGEIVRRQEASTVFNFFGYVPLVARAALTLGEREAAERLLAVAPPSGGLPEVGAERVVRAQLEEARGSLREAAPLYRQAVDMFERAGYAVERAYALLGLGRSLAAAGDPGAAEPLEQARAAFEAMGFTAADEAQALLAAVSARTAAGVPAE